MKGLTPFLPWLHHVKLVEPPGLDPGYDLPVPRGAFVPPLGCVRIPDIPVRHYHLSSPLVEPVFLVEEEAWDSNEVEPLELPKNLKSLSFGSPTADNFASNPGSMAYI